MASLRFVGTDMESAFRERDAAVNAILHYHVFSYINRAFIELSKLTIRERNRRPEGNTPDLS